MPTTRLSLVTLTRLALAAGTAALLLGACATSSQSGPASTAAFAAMSPEDRAVSLQHLADRYRSSPKDRGVVLAYAVALRGAGQSGQAVTVIEDALASYPGDPALQVAYAKALSEEGRFSQALNIIEQAIRPGAPDWNSLSVKGAILDQMGQHVEARQAYRQALTIAPNEASLYANLGLSYSLTRELADAEDNLRHAITLPGANSRIRQNLALVVGLQGRFEEARRIYAAELPAAEVEANLAYIRQMLSEQNRWSQIAAQ